MLNRMCCYNGIYIQNMTFQSKMLKIVNFQIFKIRGDSCFTFCCNDIPFQILDLDGNQVILSFQNKNIKRNKGIPLSKNLQKYYLHNLWLEKYAQLDLSKTISDTLISFWVIIIRLGWIYHQDVEGLLQGSIHWRRHLCSWLWSQYGHLSQGIFHLSRSFYIIIILPRTELYKRSGTCSENSAMSENVQLKLHLLLIFN